MILLSGMPGAGKEEFVKIAKKRGYYIVRMGDIVREYTKKLGYEVNSVNVGMVANSERERFGEAIWALRTVEKLKECDSRKVVVDGIRSLAEINIFRENFDKVFVVAILASPKTRFERIKARGRVDDFISYDEFIKRDFRELSWGVGNVIALADFYIINESSLEEFHKNVEKFLEAFEKLEK